ncbi:MAG: mechanosensitive ion channel family protein [Pseudomonadota bacterium]
MADPTPQSEAIVSPSLPADLSEPEFQALLGRLSDEQVREILIREFAVRRQVDAEAGEGFLSIVRNVGEQLSTNSRAVLAKWTEMGEAVSAVLNRLTDAGGVGFALLALALCFAAGFFARYLWRRRMARRQLELGERNAGKPAYSTPGHIRDALQFLIGDVASAVVFAVAAMMTLYVFFDNADLRIFVSSYVAVAAVVLIVRSFLELMFPRDFAVYRLVAISDHATRVLHRVFNWLAGLWVFEAITTDLMTRFGAPDGTPVLFSLTLSIVWVSSAVTGTWLLHRATTDLLPGPEQRSLTDGLTRSWAGLLGGAFFATWVLFAGGGLLSGDVDFVALAIFKVMLMVLSFWAAYRVLVHYLRAQALDEGMKSAIRRAVRATLAAVGLVLILEIWGLSPATLEASGFAGRVLQGAVSVTLTALIGWAIWDFVRTLIDLRIAAEQPASNEDEGADGEGGLGVSRSATLLPLLRSVALAAIGLTCFFTAASSLGINVAPLLAGAGVLGLAIGFGAQTLVKDIVSGVFFLVDDAFRRGEYIDLGAVKGTVERISVRSLQLRHHLGAVHTIPFGDIAALTNYSRDWVIMKLPLRLTFDTDPQLVKKIVKRIGAELMEHEEWGRGLLEPPKSQGVIQMEDSAMILRVKFKAIPGKQFPIRRELLHRIRAEFETAGIRFANREVTVRVNEGAGASERLDAIGAAASGSTLDAPEPAPAR